MLLEELLKVTYEHDDNGQIGVLDGEPNGERSGAEFFPSLANFIMPADVCTDWTFKEMFNITKSVYPSLKTELVKEDGEM